MIDLRHGDCLELMKDIPDNSIDCCITDLPYGITACKWDSVILFEPMWKELKRIVKDNGAICLFGSEPFSSHLRLSNLKMFKYDWYWRKHHTGQLNAKKQPLREVEQVMVFYKKQVCYNPQFTYSKPYKVHRRNYKGSEALGKQRDHTTVSDGKRYPKNVISFKEPMKFHPTQKPVALLEYLIKTYTLENETVLDFTMGSGSTGVACKNLNRKFIGIEKDETYFNIAEKRINEL